MGTKKTIMIPPTDVVDPDIPTTADSEAEAELEEALEEIEEELDEDETSEVG